MKRRVAAGPLALAVGLGLMTGAAALDRGWPWWANALAFAFWPAFSVAGQLWL